MSNLLGIVELKIKLNQLKIYKENKKIKLN
jgi:hypothetical protein